MSKRNLHIEEEVRKTMEMADHIQKIEGNPFLLTRVMQQLENEKRTAQEGWFASMAPVYKMAFSIVIIALNAFVFFQLDDLSINSVTSKSEVDFVDEYGLIEQEADVLTYIIEK